MVSVLVVDDDPQVAEIICEVLESLGHSVRRVTNGPDALAAVASGPSPDVVITDMMMPGGLSGVALATELRARIPGLPVVLATGCSANTAGLRASGLPVLHKPFRAAELEEAIRQALRGTPPA